jgi:hypothetical protein
LLDLGMGTERGGFQQGMSRLIRHVEVYLLIWEGRTVTGQKQGKRADGKERAGPVQSAPAFMRVKLLFATYSMCMTVCAQPSRKRIYEATREILIRVLPRR